MFLHVSSQAFPLCFTATQRGQKMKVGVLGGETLKLFAIIDVPLTARAEEQPELLSLMTVPLRQEPVQHGTKRRDAGSGRNEYGVTQGRMQNKIAERPLKRDRGACVETAEIVRHEPILHPIQAEGDMSVGGRRRRNRIGTRHILAIGSVGLYRKPLSGHEAKAGHSAHFELDVLGKLGEREGTKYSGLESFKLSH